MNLSWVVLVWALMQIIERNTYSLLLPVGIQEGKALGMQLPTHDIHLELPETAFTSTGKNSTSQHPHINTASRVSTRSSNPFYIDVMFHHKLKLALVCFHPILHEFSADTWRAMG